MKPLPAFTTNYLTLACIGIVCANVVPESQLRAAGEIKNFTASVLEKYDADKNGLLTGKEMPDMLKERLRRFDLDADGKISASEIEQLPPNAVARLLSSSDDPRPTKKGDVSVYTPGIKGIEGEFYAPAAREEFDPEALEIGDRVPGFTLEQYDKKGSVTLSDFEGKKPVVLVFGSITCQPFRQKVMQVTPIYEEFKDKAEFFMVYIREAHPESVLTVEEDGKDVLKQFVQSNDYQTRVANASACDNLLDIPYPMVVDKEDNKVKEAYSGWPIRLMVVSEEGRLVFDGGRGPKGFQPDKLQAWLDENI